MVGDGGGKRDGRAGATISTGNLCGSIGNRAMSDDEAARLRAIWNQRSTSVVIRKGKGFPLMIRLPFADDNRQWLQGAKRISPTWVAQKKHWEVPKAWFNGLVERFLVRYGKLYVIQPYNEQERCAPNCMSATKYECECSCMGANHGAGMTADWLVISDTFAVRSITPQLACRLLTRR